MSEQTATVEYDVTAIAGDPVDPIIAKFSDLTDGQLMELAELEQAGRKRKTLLEAIAETLIQRNGAGEDMDLPSDDDLRVLEDAGALDELLAEREARITELAEQVAALTSEVGQLQAENAKLKAGTKTKAKAIDPKAVTLAEDATLKPGAMTKLMFEGSDGRSLSAIPALGFDPDAFSVDERGGITLERPISFARFGTSADVHAVWLVDDAGKKGRRCRLMAPLTTGGGLSAEIPAGFLRFDIAAPAAAD